MAIKTEKIQNPLALRASQLPLPLSPPQASDVRALIAHAHRGSRACANSTRVRREFDASGAGRGGGPGAGQLLHPARAPGQRLRQLHLAEVAPRSERGGGGREGGRAKGTPFEDVVCVPVGVFGSTVDARRSWLSQGMLCVCEPWVFGEQVRWMP